MKLKIVVLIVALAGALFLLIALGSVVRSVRIRKHGAFTESTVIKSVHTFIKSPVRNVSVSFNTPDGSQVTGTASTRQFVSAGDKIRIWYDPAFPQKIDFGDTIRYNMRGVIAGGFVFLFGFSIL